MKLDDLAKNTTRGKKRLGRGLGSGKGKTGGRGQKGQKARGKVTLGFSGGGLPLYRKLPLLRGWGNRKAKEGPVTLQLKQLAVFKDGDKVNLETLVARAVVSESKLKQLGVKILGGGEVSAKLTVSGVSLSKSAREAVEKAGGHVE